MLTGCQGLKRRGSQALRRSSCNISRGKSANFHRPACQRPQNGFKQRLASWCVCVCVFFDNSHPKGCEVVSYWGFDLHFLKTNNLFFNPILSESNPESNPLSTEESSGFLAPGDVHSLWLSPGRDLRPSTVHFPGARLCARQGALK